MKSVSFVDGGLRDRDIIFRDEKDLVFCFLRCVHVVKFRHAKITAGRKGRVRILATECVSFFHFFHTHTNK